MVHGEYGNLASDAGNREIMGPGNRISLNAWEIIPKADSKMKSSNLSKQKGYLQQTRLRIRYSLCE